MARQGEDSVAIRFTNPWWVVVGAVSGLFVCNGPVLGFTFGVFLKPIMADMGWQRGTASFALSVGGVASAVMVPVIGWLMDRWGIRRVALPGLVLYTLAMGLLGLSPHSLLIFTILFALAEATSSIQTPIGYAKAIAAWFDRRRGLALGIAMSGVGLGGFVMPQLAERLIEHIGWRGAYPVLGVLTLLIAFPVVALWIREPRPGEGEHDGPAVARSELPGLTAREAAGTARFWMLLAIFFLVAIALNGTVAHVVPLLTDAGLAPAKAAATLGVFGLATMVGRLLAGYLVDRYFAAHIAAVLFLAPIAGFALLASASGVAPALGVTLVGLGLGTEIDLIAFLVSRYLGQRAFGQIYGCCFMLFGLGSSCGRFIGGLVYDLAGSYNPALIGAAAALIVAVALVYRLGAYVYPVRAPLMPQLAPQPATG
jgi:predicted MFS family arabinose efflux permease